jgi:hypothetical protein
MTQLGEPLYTNVYAWPDDSQWRGNLTSREMSDRNINLINGEGNSRCVYRIKVRLKRNG